MPRQKEQSEAALLPLTLTHCQLEVNFVVYPLWGYRRRRKKKRRNSKLVFIARDNKRGVFFLLDWESRWELLERQQGSEQFEWETGAGGQCLLWAALDSAVWCYYRWRWWRWRQRVAHTESSQWWFLSSSRAKALLSCCIRLHPHSFSSSSSTSFTSCCCCCFFWALPIRVDAANVLFLFLFVFLGMLQVVKAVSSTSTSTQCMCVCLCVWECECRSLLCCLGIAIDNNSR